MDNFSYIPVDAEFGNHPFDAESVIGRLNINADEMAGFDFYIAGNASMMTACKETLVTKGLPAEQLMLDQIEHE